MAKRPTCQSCGARILWAVTPSGKFMPLNPEPDRAKGNVQLVDNPGGRAPIARVVASGGLFDEQKQDAWGAGELYVSHFTTCPDADRFRSRRAGKRGRR